MLIKQHPSDYPDRNDDLRSIRTLLDTYTHELRQIAYDLRSHLVETLTFDTTLELYAREVGKNAGIEMNFTIAPNLPKLPEKIEVAVLRAFQEAMTNIVKHADAHDVYVDVHSDSDSVTLTLEDDGRGFYPQYAQNHLMESRHLGLIGMNERIEAVGGKLMIESAPERGTRITIAVPRILPAPRKRLRRVT